MLIVRMFFDDVHDCCGNNAGLKVFNLKSSLKMMLLKYFYGASRLGHNFFLIKTQSSY